MTTQDHLDAIGAAAQKLIDAKNVASDKLKLLTAATGDRTAAETNLDALRQNESDAQAAFTASELAIEDAEAELEAAIQAAALPPKSLQPSLNGSAASAASTGGV